MKKTITVCSLLCLFSLTALAETYYVTAKSLNVRSGIGSQNPVVGKLTQGQQVDVKNQKDGWSQVDGGWVASSFLSKNQTKTATKKKIEKDVMLVCDCISTDIKIGRPGFKKNESKICKQQQSFLINFSKLLSNADEQKVVLKNDSDNKSKTSYFYENSGNIVVKKIENSFSYYDQGLGETMISTDSVVISINRQNGTRRMSFYEYQKDEDGPKYGIRSYVRTYQCNKAPERKF